MSVASFDVAVQDLGTGAHSSVHFKRPVERPFTRGERATTTILFGGLTWKHERLIQGVLEGLGYKAQPLPTPDRRAFQTGKEYGNNGQCNPTYFTVGNLVRYLESLRAQGVPHQQILDHYVFFTAGACGPCRFGMYEAEYRLALRNSGFDGFRVLLFQQTAGLDQATPDAGLEMNLEFFLGLVNALTFADVLNEAAYAVRPYEVNPGDTDSALQKAIEHMYQALRNWRWRRAPERLPARLRRAADWTLKFLQQIAGCQLYAEFRRAARFLTEIPVDRLRVRPIVKITGEFWAQTTEGDGNFNMFRFLERENAQVLVEPVGTWITYLIHQVVQKNRDWKGLEEGALLPSGWRLPVRARIEARYLCKQLPLKLAEALFRRHYARAAAALQGLAHPLADQYELQRLGHPYY
ncbi:MAG: activator of (R)-2-hydroxyglutaryl-CoA dehydratase, partial [Bryobacteraceae bacterium]